MAEPGPPSASDRGTPVPPPDRLQRWFAVEVRAAERDVARGLVRVPSRWMGRGWLGSRGFAGGALATSAIVVVVVVALTSGFLGGTVGPSPTSGASGATGTPGPSPVPSPSGSLFADGIPSAFDGQPVLRPTQAVARAAASTDASTFLVGGWVATVYSYTGCATPTGSEGDQVLARSFCGTYLNESPNGALEGPLELHFRSSVDPDWPGVGPVIVRVHTHDPLATTCAAANQDACAHAVVVDALLWSGPALGSDGLPSWMGGQPTITVPEAQATLAASTSADELFVRGWYSGFALPCPYIPATVPPTPGSSLLPDHCQPSILGPAPIPLGQDHATADDLDLTLGPGVEAPPIGAVVLEVHGHDPAAAACDPSIRAACDAAVIVDGVLWTASGGTAPTPAPTTTPMPSPADVPTSIDGEPVLRGQAFVARVAAATDASPFLVGGWTPVTPEIYFCPAIPAPSPGVTQVLCGGLWFLDSPGDPQGTLQGTPPWVAVRVAVVTAVPGWGVPFVMRVHVRLPTATRCPPGAVACQRLVIEEALVWQGTSPPR